MQPRQLAPQIVGLSDPLHSCYGKAALPTPCFGTRRWGQSCPPPQGSKAGAGFSHGEWGAESSRCFPERDLTRLTLGSATAEVCLRDTGCSCSDT